MYLLVEASEEMGRTRWPRVTKSHRHQVKDSRAYPESNGKPLKAAKQRNELVMLVSCSAHSGGWRTGDPGVGVGKGGHSRNAGKTLP